MGYTSCLMIARQEWDGSRTIFLPSFRLAAAPLAPAHFPEAPGGELIDLEPVEADVDEPVNYAALEEVVDEDDEEEDSEDEDGFAEFEPARLEVADHQLFILKEKDEIRQTDSGILASLRFLYFLFLYFLYFIFILNIFYIFILRFALFLFFLCFFYPRFALPQNLSFILNLIRNLYLDSRELSRSMRIVLE